MILLLFSILCLCQAKHLPSLGDMEPEGAANGDRNNGDIFGETIRAISREMNEQNLCVEDNPNRLLQKEISVAHNSPSKCIAACKEAGYLLAGVQYSYQCFCGNSPPPWSVIKPGYECNLVCPGNSNQKCGGTWRMNIYSTTTIKNNL